LLDAATPNNPTAVAVSNLTVAGGNIFVRGFAQVVGEAPGPRGNDILTSAGGTFGGLIIIDPTVLTGFTISSGTDFNTFRSNAINDIASNGEVITLNLALLFTESGLEVSFVDTSDLVGASCSSDVADSSFSVGGRGGLPLDPTDTLLPSSFDDNWIFLEDDDRSLLFPEELTAVNPSRPGSFYPHGECYFQWQQQS
jgi:hypothetical protein